MKSSLLSSLVLVLLMLSWKAFGLFEMKKFEPEEKNPHKIEANRE